MTHTDQFEVRPRDPIESGASTAPRRGRRWLSARFTGSRLPVRRFVVVEFSMLPSLQPGDGLIGIRWPRVRRGQIRVFPMSSTLSRPGSSSGSGLTNEKWLVKRVGDVTGCDGAELFYARSDNELAQGVIDSRTFGPVRAAESLLVLYVHRRSRAQPVDGA